ncbi:citrate lyase beta subunit [Lachnotalea glycerini]|uniref:Citrate lyase beta subunit n=1 Tax=Lachnotalea glycerini TaxID=1763509 RepID=A0A255IR72_9FIRM|nr:HpcH/HpaI aldolase/citrate lyase family protein [Lachnotalea glycerini]PXV93413.1 citrate lyase beta subunit [Lachnotalea glycerini]RDY31868.1 hypothetical protein CG710_007745 [Lachnotalea glycerini]
MKNSIIYYSVGALLYCPANNGSIVDSIVNERFGKQFSLALCLEDTIKDNLVHEAEAQLVLSLKLLKAKTLEQSFYIPKLFIRVREAAQMKNLIHALGDSQSIVTGFILPKFSLENANLYLSEIRSINSGIQKFYIMPILESPTMIDLQSRYYILSALKQYLDSVSEWVLNVRVGGNDLCNVFGFRRHVNETIYDLKPIAAILTDIITTFGRDYVISGPVWEYYNGNFWEMGLCHEIERDIQAGFTGKTVIHPNQISIVNQAFKVEQADYDDAVSVLNWNPDSTNLVSGNFTNERMNEHKTHCCWAQRILYMAKIYGIKTSTPLISNY